MSTIEILAGQETRPTASLLPYARNSRRHPEAQLAQLERGFREYGFTIPVLVDEDGGIIAGHGRVVVATRLGMPEVPVIVARGWPDEKKRAYVIADNAIAEGAEWDHDLLVPELLELQGLGVDLGGLGFDADALLKLLEPAELKPAKARARRRSRGGPMVEAFGDVLDEAIAEIEEGLGHPVDRADFSPSTRVEHGCPIMFREQIDLRCKVGTDGMPDEWRANAPGFLPESHIDPLVAGMRAVLAKHRGGVPS